MRVIAGEAKSLHLKVPAQAGIRPTTDAMRESVFASLQPEIAGARFADLYAGSGAVGIEALSRGACFAVFVEHDPHCTKVIRENLANTGLADRGLVVQGRLPAVWTQIARLHGPFDIVFVDAPYDSPTLTALAEELIHKREGVATEAIIVLQHDRPEPILDEPRPDKSKVFGQSQVDIYYLAGVAQGQGN